jgi:hypothetical protein
MTTLRQRGIRRKVRKFYEDQNANIERMLKSVDEHRLAADAAHEEKQLKVSSCLSIYLGFFYFYRFVESSEADDRLKLQ